MDCTLAVNNDIVNVLHHDTIQVEGRVAKGVHVVLKSIGINDVHIAPNVFRSVLRCGHPASRDLAERLAEPSQPFHSCKQLCIHESIVSLVSVDSDV